MSNPGTGPDGAPLLTIGVVAKLAGKSASAIRYQEAVQYADVYAGGKAPLWACHVDWGSSTRQYDRVRYRRACGSVPARGKSLWSGCKTRSFASWRSAVKQEAAEVSHARHRLNL